MLGLLRMQRRIEEQEENQGGKPDRWMISALGVYVAPYKVSYVTYSIYMGMDSNEVECPLMR